MSLLPQTPSGPWHTLPVFAAKALRCVGGSNLGDALGRADDLILNDCYGLSAQARAGRLTVDPDIDDDSFRVARNSSQGRPGARVVLDACMTLMHGVETIEVFILAEISDEGHEQVYLMPTARLEPKREYTLVKIDRRNPVARLADLSTVSFAQGTHVLMANGAQVPIEKLAVGDLVMTRDHGPQPIRWIGQQTIRATGAMAPIVIRKGTLNNGRDLVLGPNHRLFIYQRGLNPGDAPSEVMVKARHLVDGDAVSVVAGGHVDYFQILFDRHEIVYVEGIAAESLLADQRSRQLAMAAGVTRQGAAAPQADRQSVAVADPGGPLAAGRGPKVGNGWRLRLWAGGRQPG